MVLLSALDPHSAVLIGVSMAEMGMFLSSLWAVLCSYLQCCQAGFSQAAEELLTANPVATTGKYPSSRSARLIEALPVEAEHAA